MIRSALAAVLLAAPLALPASAAPEVPLFGGAFAATWHDGKAELAGYALTFPRYGEERTGTAVAITVTEPFSWEPRVKAGGADTFGVVKLNLMEDFPTGVYDYNLMTSAFVAAEPVEGLPAGAPVKLTFTAQEWCGHAFQQDVFFPDKLEHRSFSYFEGKAEKAGFFRLDEPLYAEDALFLWARGLAAPAVDAGEEAAVSLYRSAAVVQLTHVPPRIDAAVLERAAETTQMDTAIGRIAVREATVKVERSEAPAVEHAFWVEEAPPHRVVKWTRSDGFEAVLIGVDRMPYWSLNGRGGEEALARIGLEKRPPLTP
ncbi:hypothetical protein [Phycisphaera mikurensis]|uniref:Uncharacterized protein n=1 Tax=Phycisphaera mikurensis (strain NBRC 102666 / KCTC 22515 / FYK2301M01) TaxID=1142394 RepID=I0II59_PHYMF|nr:hypothetical protein [Phycisphaera mikurensis]MBB6442490.1 hypothetical protein [Phycisphaera mikurensis]BAM04947.1 hypothetical protein PSMK_27880 [Phycisphaera mikurensis NBRC 102666]